MKTLCIALIALAGLSAAPSAPADLQKVMAEPNLEKRSKLALDYAMLLFQGLREDYQKGDNDKVAVDAKDIEESVNLAYDSLVQTGKNPRRSPGWFKKAELETRDLARRLDGFQQEMGMNERQLLEKVKARVQKVHDDLLLGLMEGTKK